MRSALATVVCAVFLLVVVTPAGAVSYAGVALSIRVSVPPPGGSWSVHDDQVGWMTNNGLGLPTTDGYDEGWDVADTTPNLLPGMIETNIVNPIIAAGRVNYDFRAPVPGTSAFEIWRLKATIPNNPEHVGAVLSLKASFVAGYLPADAQFVILDGDFTTQAACLAAASGPAFVCRLTPTNAAAGYSSGALTWSLPAPMYDPENEMWSVPAKYFTVYAAQVPEPSTLAVALSGLVGLLVCRIRRRR